MLEIRQMGTKNDIKWFEKILKRRPKVAVTEVSDLYRNKVQTRITGPMRKCRKSISMNPCI